MYSVFVVSFTAMAYGAWLVMRSAIMSAWAGTTATPTRTVAAEAAAAKTAAIR